MIFASIFLYFLYYLLHTLILHHKDDSKDDAADEVGCAAGLDHEQPRDDEEEALIWAAVIGEEAAECGADSDHARERREGRHDERERSRIHHEDNGREDEDVRDDERRDREF